MWLNPTGHKTIDFIINVNFSYSGRLMLRIFESASSRAVKEVCHEEVCSVLNAACCGFCSLFFYLVLI